MTRPIFFCHIPKTAGTTVRAALEAAFRPHEIIPDQNQIRRNLDNYPKVGVVVSTISACRIPIKLVRGHYHYSLHRLLDDPIKIVVLREPIARTISFLKHLVAHGGWQQKKILEVLDEGRVPGPDNEMVRYLGGSLITDEPLNIRQRILMKDPIGDGEARLAEAKAVLGEVDILGVTDRLELIREPLRRLGVAFKGERRNEARIADLGLSERHLQTIREHNVLDAALYRAAVELMDNAADDTELEPIAAKP